MKQSLKLTLYTILLLVSVGFTKNMMALKGPSCDSAKVLSYPISNAVTSYTSSYYWFKITLDAGDYKIHVSNTAGPGKIYQGDVYTGTCSSLTFVKMDSVFSSSSTEFDINIHNTVNATAFYVKLYNRGGSVSFNKTMATGVAIAGQLGFCPGQQVTLLAFPYNPNGTQTYTWLPSGTGDHASSYTVTPSSTVTATTYTLVYHDTGGTLTTTISIFPLGPNECKNCEQVQNGHFEWSDAVFGGINMYDAQYWYGAAVSGSAAFGIGGIYFSLTTYPGLAQLPHSGNAYASIENIILNNNRQYIESPLRCALVAGQAYNVSFYAHLERTSTYACNNIGAHLSVSALTTTVAGSQYTVTPQLNSSAVINYSTPWTQVTGTVTGNNEQYITIGNFFSNAATTLSASTSPSATALGSNQYYIDDVSITPLTPTLSASSNTVCPASVMTLTATGASSLYTTWTNGVSTYSGSVVNIPTPSTTTTYTCNVNLPCASCAPLTQTILITVIPAVTVTSNTNIICTGTTTLTASGASSYTWNPGGVTTATIAVSPTVTTVYTITSIYSGGYSACTSTTLVNPVVSTLCCSASNTTIGTSLTSTVSISGTYTTAATVVDMQGVILITGNTLFNGYTLRMKPGTLISVLAGTTLTFTNCKLFSCSELWDGILLRGDHGANCGNIVINGTTVEDMYNGIRVDYEGVAYDSGSPTTIGSMSVTSSTFNKNYISFEIKNSIGVTSGSTTPYPFSMITSTISSTTSTTSPGSTLKPSSTYTYAYNQITNGTDGTSAPYLNFPRNYIGISLYNLEHYGPVLIGTPSSTLTNTFDNMDFGIRGTEVYAKIYNNYFKNITGSPKQEDIDNGGGFPAGGPDEIGIAVSITQTATANYFACEIGSDNSLPAGSNPFPRGNKFEDCNKGVQINNCRYTTVKANVFISTGGTDIPVVTTTGSPPFQITINNPNTYYYYKAQNAIWVTALGTAADLNYNYIRNHGTGIYNNFTLDGAGTRYIDIIENDIEAPSATGWCKQAIQVDQVGGSNMPTDELYIYNNTIDQVYGGIAANNVLSGLLIKQNPHVYVESTAKTYNYAATSSRNCIALANCEYGYVKGNTVSSNTSPIPSSTTTAQYLNGICLTNSKFGKVECNSATTLGRDFVFSGTCNNTWLTNSMSNSYTGLEIKSSGVIGPQGANSYTGTPNLSANTWTTITRQTSVLLSSGTNTLSPLYLLAGGNTEPTLNFGTAGHTYSVGPALGIRVTTGTSYTCNAGSAQRMSNTNSINGNTNRTAADESDSLKLYTALATNDASAYEVFPDEFVYQNKQMVYNLLKQDSISAIAGSALDSFYVENKYTAINQLTEVQDAIAANDVNGAITKNLAVTASNSVEQKHQRANELTLKYLNDRFYIYTSQEKQDLISMANECLVKGYYVTQSRNIINLISNRIISYDDHCDEEANASRKAKVSDNSISSATSFLLFPNPSNGSMQMDYDLGNDSEAIMKLYDVTGKLINTNKLSNTKGTMQMNEQTLHNGLYFYHILVGEKIIKTDKVVIIK